MFMGFKKRDNKQSAQKKIKDKVHEFLQRKPLSK